jgi:PAS domain S-box-containing protein
MKQPCTVNRVGIAIGRFPWPTVMGCLRGWLRAALALLALAGTAPAAELYPVRLQLKWYHQFQFAGYYAAQLKGFYRDTGLDVTIRQAQQGDLPLPMVESGAVEFGVSDMEVFRAYQEGRPLMALGVVFQHSPMVILSLANSGIRRPSDLAGRRVMFQGGQGQAEFQAMLESEGVPLGSVQVVPHSWRLDELLQGRVDAVSAYLTNETYQLQRLGMPYAMLRPEEYGVDFYGDLLFTSRSFALEHPDQAEAFRRASFQGWEYAMEHPGEIIDYILTLPGVVERGVTRDQLNYEALQMRALVLPGLVDIGHMNPGRFSHIAEWWTQLGILKAPRDVDGFLFPRQNLAIRAWIRALKVGSLVVLAAALAVMLWITQLRRTVGARTRELRSEIGQHRLTEQALRESESRYRSILDASPDAIVFSDHDGRIRMVSPRALGLLQAERGDQVVGRMVLDFLVPEDRERARNRYQQLLMGEPPGPAAYRGLRQDGSTYQLEVNGAALCDPDGRRTGLVLVVRDITERCRAEQERQELQARLNHANRMESLGILAGGVAHDMNNVLAAILGTASLHAEMTPADSVLHRGLLTITQAAERGGRMVRSLLNFSRQSPEEDRELNLNTVLEEDMRLLEHATLSRIKVAMDLAPDLAPVRGDAAALAHAFMNVCVNAVDAMPEGGALSVRTRNLGPDQVEVRIKDSGCGMPRAVLDRAMDPFFTTKEPGKGTGLGLAIVYSTVKAHRGSIVLHSQEGGGTEVVLRFPSCPPGTREEGGAAEDQGRPGRVAMSVLVVDDDDLVRGSLQDMLQSLGHYVTPASCGEEALVLLDQLVPDLVLLDVNLPGIGGAGTMVGLRQRHPDLPVLLVTGRADPAVLRLMDQHGSVSLLKKPFSVRDLQARLAGLFC